MPQTFHSPNQIIEHRKCHLQRLFLIISHSLILPITDHPRFPYNLQLMQPTLSHNAVVHISAGFEGPFLMQAFSVRKNQQNPQTVDCCLTDGEVYIGARYQGNCSSEIQNYSLLKITACFEDRSHPITMKSVEIVGKANRLMGKAPYTLQESFFRELKDISMGQPSKKIKPNQVLGRAKELKKVLEQQTAISNKVQDIQIGPTATGAVNSACNDPNGIVAIPATPKNKGFSNEKRQLRFASDSEEEHPKEQSNNDAPKQLEKNSVLSDLWQYKTGWILLCRVNYASIVECSNGLFAVNFVIEDEVGNQMKCVYFAMDCDFAKNVLQIGNYYLFAFGQIKPTKERELQITFDKTSLVMKKCDVRFKIDTAKTKRIDELNNEENETFVSVIGVLRKIKAKEQLKSKVKYTATLCDPIRRTEVDFMLFLANSQSDVKEGMVIVLHNFKVSRVNQIIRLNSTFKSYYFSEKEEDHTSGLVHEMYRLSKVSTDSQVFRNISMFTFTSRTILDLREIIQRTDDERIYSNVDCWVLEIMKKKAYQACKTCKKVTEKKEMGLYECSYCKKMVDIVLTYTLGVVFTDFTASCIIDVIGEHAETLLDKRTLEFHLMNPEDQNAHLERLKYKNVQLRLKTEKKKTEKKETHSVWKIEAATPEHSLKEVKRLLAFEKIKINW